MLQSAILNPLEQAALEFVVLQKGEGSITDKADIDEDYADQ